MTPLNERKPMKVMLAVAMMLLGAQSAQADIVFKAGWDSSENSDAKKYTEKEAKEFLRNQSEDLKKIIDGPAVCVLEVTKGCHQPGKAHFTVNGLKCKDKCKVKSLYVGSKSDHEPACN